MMNLTFLGTGTSTGVPTLGCDCEVCQSTDPRDHRLRCSSLLEVDDKKILIDCGPDFRQQALREHISSLDAILLTHAHYDHVGGMDDLRVMQNLQLYASEKTNESVRKLFYYCFQQTNYVGMLSHLNLHDISENLDPFCVADNITVQPIRAMHAYLPVLGFRIGDFAYLTDFKTIEPSEKDKMKGLDVLVLGMLRIEPHRSHLSLSEALELVDELKPSRCYFVHMCHQIGLHNNVQKSLPENCFLAYDGLKISIK